VRAEEQLQTEQLKITLQRLREALETSRVQQDLLVKQAESLARSETGQLQQTIRALREQLQGTV
jgi:hypothetical protein